MQYSTNKKKRSSKIWIFVVVVILVILLRVIRTPIQPFFIFISKPFISLGAYIKHQTVGVSSVGKSKSELLAEIDTLKKENETLSLENNTLVQDKALIDEFKESFGLFPEILNLQYAHIISKPNQSVYDTVLISRGKNDGLVVGQSVFINNFALIGYIDSITDKTATVLLFSSPGKNTNARLERTGYDVILIGRGGGNMIVEVPKEVETALGDKLVYPVGGNKVIGIIRDITSDDRDANKKLYITLPTNVLTLDHVFIQK